MMCKCFSRNTTLISQMTGLLLTPKDTIRIKPAEVTLFSFVRSETWSLLLVDLILAIKLAEKGLEPRTAACGYFYIASDFSTSTLSEG